MYFLGKNTKGMELRRYVREVLREPDNHIDDLAHAHIMVHGRKSVKKWL